MNTPSLLNNHRFLLHVVASFIAQAGGFFSMVAMPWLVLGITDNNPAIMATVTACGALPHSIFMVLGGVLSDRYSSLNILRYSRALLVIVLILFGLVVKFTQPVIGECYFFALLIGVLCAIAIPAAQSLLPSMVANHQLGIANAIIMSGMQIAQIVGPFCAGALIWWIKTMDGVGAQALDINAISTAFFVDAVGMGIALLLTFFIRVPAFQSSSSNIRAMLWEGISFCLRDKGMRVVLAYLMLLSFFLHGVLYAGLPVFTKIHLGLSENTYGNLYAMMGIGTVMGVVIGLVLNPSARVLGMLVLLCDFINALCLLFLSFTNTFLSAAPLLVAMGVCGGTVMIAGVTWFQQRAPGVLVGRVLGILMFAVMGLMPVSASIVGVLMLTYPITNIMAGAAITLMIFTLLGMMLPDMRNAGVMPRVVMS